jgi:hypothetical protein
MSKLSTVHLLSLIFFFIFFPVLCKAKETVVACAIYDANHTVIRNFPGQACEFFADGSYVSGDTKGISRYDKNLKELWHLTMHTHHIISVTKEGQLLVASSEIRDYCGTKVRFDILYLLNLDGKIEKTFRLYDHKKELDPLLAQGKLCRVFPFTWDPTSFPDIKKEFTHLNSYFEIPRNPVADKIPAFAEGNFILNANGPGQIFIIDKEFKKVLWSISRIEPQTEIPPTYHNVQILSNGNLFVYNNVIKEKDRVFSSIDEYDPVTKKIVWQYRASPPESFYAPTGGGIQLLDNGNILFNDLTKETDVLEVTRKHKVVSKWTVPLINEEGVHVKFLTAKQYDLTKFLSLNKGL